MNVKILFCAAATLSVFNGCTDYLSLPAPRTERVADEVFGDARAANSAVLGIYGGMVNAETTFASGGTGSFTTLADLGAGILDYNRTFATIQEFGNRRISPENSTLYNIWSSAYATIYRANAVIEGLGKSTLERTDTDTFTGEALFVRAFCHFYLLNAFGDIPLVTTTDYRINNKVGRTPKDEVYRQIKDDLKAAIGMLGDGYGHAGGERVRVNRWTAEALLSRAHLYAGDYADAEELASSVIAQTHLYEIEPDLDGVFMKNSKEAIWQLFPVGTTINTYEAYNAINFLATRASTFTLSDRFLQEFEIGDRRREHWVKDVQLANGEIVPCAFKYKILRTELSEPKAEYSMVMRLAEVHLIRAEARLMASDYQGALADINLLRLRHGKLPPLELEDHDAVMQAIERERMVEFFYEWGHRWFDLKRWGKAVQAIGVFDPDFAEKHTHYPLPEREMHANPSLTPQNLGY